MGAQIWDRGSRIQNSSSTHSTVGDKKGTHNCSRKSDRKGANEWTRSRLEQNILKKQRENVNNIQMANDRVHAETLQYSLWIRPTDALNSNFIGITTLHVSGSLSARHQEFLAVHRLWYILCSCVDRLLPGVGWNAVPSYSWQKTVHHNRIKCTKGDVRLRTPDDGQKGCPKHVES